MRRYGPVERARVGVGPPAAGRPAAGPPGSVGRVAFGSQENAYFRQVLTYWEHAAALVAHGALHSNLFFDTQGEMWFVYAKLEPFLEEIRQRTGVRDSMKNIEAVIFGSDAAKQRLAAMQERAKRFREMRAAQPRS